MEYNLVAEYVDNTYGDHANWNVGTFDDLERAKSVAEEKLNDVSFWVKYVIPTHIHEHARCNWSKLKNNFVLVTICDADGIEHYADWITLPELKKM